MKVKYLFLLALMPLLIAGCGKKTKEAQMPRSEFIRPASIDFTKQDSADIMALVNHYIACVNSKRYNDAFHTLYYLSGRDSVKPMTEHEINQAVEVYSHMPIYGCELFSFSLNGKSENVIKVGLKLTKDGNVTNGLGVTYVGLRPVKVGNKWYLTFLDNDSLRIKEM